MRRQQDLSALKVRIFLLSMIQALAYRRDTERENRARIDASSLERFLTFDESLCQQPTDDGTKQDSPDRACGYASTAATFSRYKSDNLL